MATMQGDPSAEVEARRAAEKAWMHEMNGIGHVIVEIAAETV